MEIIKRLVMSALVILLHKVDTQTRKQLFQKKSITRVRIFDHLIQVYLQQFKSSTAQFNKCSVCNVCGDGEKECSRISM